VEEEGAGVEVNTSIGIFTGVFRHTVPGRLNTGESWQKLQIILQMINKVFDYTVGNVHRKTGLTLLRLCTASYRTHSVREAGGEC
jgi:hypothetical protein